MGTWSDFENQMVESASRDGRSVGVKSIDFIFNADFTNDISDGDRRDNSRFRMEPSLIHEINSNSTRLSSIF
jgi:hypothetical protein